VSPTELDNATTAIASLFNTLEIRRVISVDDLYVQDPTPDDLIGLLTSAPEAAQAIPEIKDIDFAVDADIWGDRLRATWNEITRDRQIAILQQVRTTVGDDQELDSMVGGTLAQLFSNYEFHPLTLKQWQAQKADLLDVTKMPNTVVLFDESFTKEGGSATAGLGLIQDAYVLCPDHKLVCGLLSQNYTIDREFEAWQQLAQDNHLEEHRFVLIAKEHLQKNLTGFATQIKLTVLNQQCKDLKDEAVEVLKKAHEEAAKELCAMNIYDFEHIVFRSSYREGIWEPDTLFRVFGLFHRGATRDFAKQSKTLATQAAAIRKVSSLPIPGVTTLPHTTWKIQRLELYEEADHLNNHYLPTDLGDIYQKTNGNKQFILLAQPCDLMVRNDKKPGRRPSMYEATIAEILDEPTDDPTASAELKYFSPETGSSVYVNFGRTHTIKLCVLDLCAFRTDGKAAIFIKDAVSSGVIPSWQRYYSVLQKDALKLLKDYEALKRTNKKEVALIALLTKANHKGAITADIDQQQGKIEYHIKRVRRLLQPRAGELLNKYAAYKSRDAFEHDFGDLPANNTPQSPSSDG
jgi:hypothetical protein